MTPVVSNYFLVLDAIIIIVYFQKSVVPNLTGLLEDLVILEHRKMVLNHRIKCHRIKLILFFELGTLAPFLNFDLLNLIHHLIENFRLVIY